MVVSLIFRKKLAQRVAAALGVTLAAPVAFVGCGAKVVVDSESTGTGGAGGAGGSTTTNATSSSTGPMECEGGWGELSTFLACIPDVGESCPSTQEAYGPVAQSLDICSCLHSVDVGPKPDPSGNGLCCYDITIETVCAVGRPLLAEDGPAVAPVEAARRGWSEEPLTPNVEGLSAEAREALAERWIRDGLFEHASVAAFSRLALALLAHGADESLVRAAHEAALDEVRHARLSLSLAAAYRGAPVAPRGLPEALSLPLGEGLVELAVSTVVEGAVGETLAAVLASEQAERASDPAVRQVLTGIAEDEARHAELAFRVLAFAIAAGGAPVRDAVARAFRDAAGHLPSPPPEPPLPAEVAAAHGHVPRGDARAAFVRAMHDVVMPLGRALVA
ncbi:ferritin-like domain-containing protein [Polyangium jinanense]|uniref:Ferritin-like domain-containing protein n=1 Tax=Polyangium jinanense TaxID=2829994 RepID=A0A9X3XHK3_9BACT|nr:ferritin-like domain-containing protein [Polyangium jinanense]MDC3957199.1 ferritin-like domain-containing protein [Polyangium jinanense]MDC3989475.1 ferritin-like domain-containing protein [Polyangium jinanense]